MKINKKKKKIKTNVIEFTSRKDDKNSIPFLNNTNIDNTELSNPEKSIVVIYNKKKSKNMTIYKNYFTISGKEFFYRFLCSIIPFNSDFYRIIKKKPDLLGPIIIYTFLIVLGSILGNLLKEKSNNVIISNILNYIFKCSIIIYGIGFCLPLIISFLTKLIKKKLDVIFLISIYGYSFSIFLIVLILCIVFRNIDFKIIVGIGLCFAIGQFLFNLCQIIVNIKIYKILFFNITIIILHVCLFLLCFLIKYKNEKNDPNNHIYNENQNKYLNNFKNNTLTNDTNQNIFNNISQNIFNNTTQNIFKNTTQNIFNNISQNIFNNISQNITIIENITKINTEKKNIIPIAISTDDRYSIPTYIFLFSLMENIGPNTKYNIYLMTNGLYPENKNRINTLITKYGSNKININYIKINNNHFKNSCQVCVKQCTYYRIILPTLLPNIDKIIYSDVDVINNGDLTEMYNLEIPDNIYFLGPHDYLWSFQDFLNFGIENDKYINAGIMLMNLKAMRFNNISEKLLDFISKYINDRVFVFKDQTAINIVCINNIGILPIKFAVFNFGLFERVITYNNEMDIKYRYNIQELKQAFEHPYMIHYAGDKPWEIWKQVWQIEYWWYYVKKSDYFEEIIRYYYYSPKEINNIIKNFIPKPN